MMLTDSDREWLRIHHPGLTAHGATPNVYTGQLGVDMFYDKANRQYIINPTDIGVDDRMRIRDSYSVEVDFNVKDELLPLIKETGGRIQTIARERSLKLADLHINSTGEACLCFEFEKPSFLLNGFNVPDYFHRLVIPFFYAESYFEKHSIWPWGQYSHGELGMFEWYFDKADHDGFRAIESSIAFLKRHKGKNNYETQLRGERKIKGHQNCPCGSGKIFRDCHSRAFKGLWKMHEEIQLSLKKDKTTRQQLKEMLNGF